MIYFQFVIGVFSKSYWQGMLILCVFSLSLLGSTSANASDKPSVKPDGWVHEAHPENISNYLKSHFDIAKAKGLTPFVYIYSDRNLHCRNIRALMGRDDMKAALAGTHIIMINDIAVQRSKKKRRPMKEFTPVIGQVSESGAILGELLYPELIMFYPRLIEDPMLRPYTRIKGHASLPNHAFSRVLKKYFQKL